MKFQILHHTNKEHRRSKQKVSLKNFAPKPFKWCQFDFLTFSFIRKREISFASSFLWCCRRKSFWLKRFLCILLTKKGNFRLWRDEKVSKMTKIFSQTLSRTKNPQASIWRFHNVWYGVVAVTVNHWRICGHPWNFFFSRNPERSSNSCYNNYHWNAIVVGERGRKVANKR